MTVDKLPGSKPAAAAACSILKMLRESRANVIQQPACASRPADRPTPYPRPAGVDEFYFTAPLHEHRGLLGLSAGSVWEGSKGLWLAV